MSLMKFDGHQTKLENVISSLFDVCRVDNKFSDVHVKVGQRTFYCHKLVLRINSDHFAQLPFTSGTVTVHGIKPDLFYLALQFMYTGEIVLSTNNIESVHDAAHLLRMEDLKKLCFDFLMNNVGAHKGQPSFERSGRNHQSEAAVLVSNPITLTLDCEQLSKTVALRDTSDEMMKAILHSDNLNMNSEQEVCEMLTKWFDVQFELRNEVHPEQFLPLIRWSGISVYYIQSRLLQNPILTSSEACITFLSKVIKFLITGVQFECLRTFHRQSTGVENSLIVIGLNSGTDVTKNHVAQISLQQPYSVILVTKEIPETMMPEAPACISGKDVFITGIGTPPVFDEVWRLDLLSGCWFLCAPLIRGRRRHCAAIVGSMLYVLGGWFDFDKTTLSSIECYNMLANKWSSAGNLINAVRATAGVTYKNFIYIFGGYDTKDKAVSHVQVYNPTDGSCSLMCPQLPCAYSHLRAVLWDTSVILMHRYTCFVYNFDTKTWLERKRFSAGLTQFGLVLDNQSIFVAGGGVPVEDKDKRVSWTCSDEIKSVYVLDIIKDKPAVWKHHSKLCEPGLVQAYCLSTLPI